MIKLKLYLVSQYLPIKKEKFSLCSVMAWPGFLPTGDERLLSFLNTLQYFCCASNSLKRSYEMHHLVPTTFQLPEVHVKRRTTDVITKLCAHVPADENTSIDWCPAALGVSC